MTTTNNFRTGLFLVLCMATPGSVYGDELTHRFKSPSFSGVNTSSHYLTIENQEKSRKDALQDKLDAAILSAAREEDNTTLAKFIRNLESRIYSNLSRQLVDQLFEGEGSDYGSFVLEGNTVTYEKSICIDAASCTLGEDIITMTILAEDGSVTIITIPVGTGTIGP